MKTILFPLITAAALLTGSVRAQNEYAEIARLRGLNESVRGIRSMADGEHYTTLESNDIVRYSYASAAPGESMLPAPAPNLVITDYAFSPDERSILIASGRKPIYRHSPKRRATPPSRPTGRRSPTRTATISTSTTSPPRPRAASPTTGRGTR